MHPLPVMNAFRTKAYFSSEIVVEKVENKWLRCVIPTTGDREAGKSQG